MNIILKKARKDFKNLGWRRHLIIAVVILCLGGGLGLYYAIAAAMPTLNHYFDSVNHADYTYQLSDDTWINQTQLDGLDDVDEIEDYTGRLFWYASIQLPKQDDRKYLLLIGLDPDISWPIVYNYTIESGENFNQNSNNLSAVVDSTFAENNELEVGDNLDVDGLNHAELKISGLCNAPEFLAMTSNPEFLLPIEGSMGVVFLSQETLKNYIIQYYEWLNQTDPGKYTPYILYHQSVDYNNIAITFEEAVDISDGNDAVIEYFESICNVNIKKAEKFEDSYAYKLMEADVSDTGEILMMLLIFMALMGGIVVYIIFNRYVYSQKQQVGILLGLGYTKKDTMKYFLFNIGVISAIAIPIGIFLGFAFGYIMINYMLMEMAHVGLFDFPFIFIPEVLYLGLVIGGALVFFSTFFSVRKINKKIIAELIYEQEEVTRKIKEVKKAPKPSRNITNKLVIRNTFRNRRRFYFTMIAMTFSLMIVAATQSLVDSMYHNIDRTFQSPNSNVEPSEKWDLNIDFISHVNTSTSNSLIDDINDVGDIKKTKVYTKGFINVKNDDEDIGMILLGIDLEVNDDFHHFTWHKPKEDNSIADDSNEIVISSVLSIKLEKAIGDDLKFKNDEGESFTFEIVGVHADLVSCAYVNLNEGQRITQDSETYVDGLYVILESDADKKQVKDDIYDLGNIEVIFDAEEMNEKIRDFMETYVPMIQIIVYFTFLVSFFIVFYNSIMNIYDKNYEYGILRSLGYPKRDVYKIILVENLIQGIFPIVLALAFTYPITLQMAQAYEENFSLEVVVGYKAILMVIFPPIILYTMGSFIGLRTVYKQNLYEQVQTRFVG